MGNYMDKSTDFRKKGLAIHLLKFNFAFKAAQTSKRRKKC
jgi:hypothetical protein